MIERKRKQINEKLVKKMGKFVSGWQTICKPANEKWTDEWKNKWTNKLPNQISEKASKQINEQVNG